MAQTELKRTADAGGGQYFDAKNAAQLNQALGGISKSLAEYNEYVRCLSANKQDVYRLFSNREHQIFTCVTNKSQMESAAIRRERQQLSLTKDERGKCSALIIESQNAREKSIRDWKDDIIKRIKPEKTFRYEQLERELKELTEKRAELTNENR